MIQLASAPNPSRMGLPPAANDDRAGASEFRRSRTGHAWPFISRQTVRQEQSDDRKTPTSDHGS